MSTKKRTGTANGSNGSKWIRPEKRIRLYQRDGWRCAWCGRRVYSPALVAAMRAAPPAGDAQPATLDHFHSRAHQHGKLDHSAGNLITACLSCNSERQDKPAARFARMIATRTHQDAREILARIAKLRKRALPELSEVDPS